MNSCGGAEKVSHHSRVERLEHVAPHLVAAAVEPAVREPLRLVPLDLGIEIGEHRLQVVALEGVVGATDEVDGPHRRTLD